MKDLKKRIQALNKAYILFQESVDLLADNIEKTSDMNTYLWRFSKAFKDVNKEIMKQLKKQNIDEQFLKMMKDL